MSRLCKWLHEQLEQLPVVKYPFELQQLPLDGIYFFYEVGEIWGHGGDKPRIVRIGTHRDGNFRSRIAEHFLLNESKMNFDATQPAPHERSIFRKNIGRALLNRQNEDYLKVWEIDFMSRANREKFGHLRDIAKEKSIESEITRILRENFSFRFIVLDVQVPRMGSKGLESSLIGTVAHCSVCRPSKNWLGNFSPIAKIRETGLWQIQHLKAESINETDMRVIEEAIGKITEFETR